MKAILKLSLMSVLLAGGAVAADLIERDVSRLKLRPEVCVRGDATTLADVLDFTAADPRLLSEIADQPLVTDAASPAMTTVSHDQVVRRLDELGVNMARVLVCGALTCRVTRMPALADAAADADRAGPLLRSPRTSPGQSTLAELLRSHIEDDLSSLGGTVELEFERAGDEFLALTNPPFDFSIRGDRGRKLGLREFRITIRRDGRVQRTVRLGARVSLIKQVVVAAKPLNVGTYVKRDSLEFATRVFSDDHDLGIDHPEQVVGQHVNNFVPVGRMLTAGDLKAVDLVKRSQPVTVVGGGSVRIRITGDALDSGGYGDTIRVRLGDTRRTRREVRAVVTGVGTVRLAEERL